MSHLRAQLETLESDKQRNFHPKIFCFRQLVAFSQLSLLEMFKVSPPRSFRSLSFQLTFKILTQGLTAIY